MVKKNNKRKTLKRKKSLKRKKIGGASPASSEELDRYTRPTSEIGDSQRPVESSLRSPDLPTFISEQLNNNVIQPVARHDSNEERERRLNEELLELITQRNNLILEINRIKAEIKRIQESNKRQRAR